MLDTVKWGIIGCGDVTEVKSGPAFSRVPHSELVAVMRRDGAKAADYAQRHGVPKWYDQADDLLNDPEVNAIYVATPPDTHKEYTIKALRLGKPVYVEKPMALNTAQCEEMVRVSEETGTPLFVAYYRRALPYFLKVKELVEQGVIGDIKTVHTIVHKSPSAEETAPGAQPKWRVLPEVSGGGHFHDLASHQFDFLEFLLGPITQATGVARNQAGLYPADDAVVAAFGFDSGVVGSGSWCFTVPPNQQKEETYLLGSKGKITFSFFEMGKLTIETEHTTEVLTIPAPAHIQQPMIESVVAALRGEGTCASTGETGTRSSRILDLITQG
ncbi:Gfo/Idh/MocA family protein [Telluribacter sp. SYSU D00476]|uniref:Gfo/Idh/MocA family protein n=1 Tax=Telluribacter sp. SYSU D00476 TaxID=2811430 RepID=UPI001FF2258B|nr:Gfo/Idh/MocA family oxidoreductase [Telluribacter sp. SYSU D00476]